MARKKANRSQSVTSSKKDTSTQVLEENKSTATTATAVKEKAPASQSVTSGLPTKPKDTPSLERKPHRKSWGTMLVKTLGSLQLAVTLLSIFALVVFLGTWMEHAYGTPYAQFLVYQSWWFNFLLIALAVNIFFAAVKKAQFPKEPVHIPRLTGLSPVARALGVGYVYYLCSVVYYYWPWKWYQSGFLITHVGLITMCAGGILNGIAGVDAQMQLVDSSDPDVLNRVAKEYGYIPNTDNVALDSTVFQINVTSYTEEKADNPMAHKFGADQPGEKKKVEELVYDIAPGPLPWKGQAQSDDAKFDLSNTFIGAMNFLQSPLGHSDTLYMKDGTRIETIDHIPLAQREDFVKAEKDETGRPAYKIRLRSPRFPRPIYFWISDDCLNVDQMANALLQGGALRMDQFGPARVEIIGCCSNQALLGEFLSPPDLTELGERGVLSVQMPGGTLKRFSLDEIGDKSFMIDEATKTEIKVNRIENEFVLWINKDGRKVPLIKAGQKLPVNPAVSFDLFRDGEKLGEVTVHARAIGVDTIMPVVGVQNLPKIQQLFGVELANNVPNAPMFFYHAPDPRGSDQHLRGVLQLVRGPMGDVFYRSFKHQDAGFECEGSGKIDPEADTSVWGKMQWQFRMVDEIENAKYQVWYSPVDIPLGKETPRDKMTYPSVLHLKIIPKTGDPIDLVYVQFGKTKTVKVGDKTYTIQYSYKTKDLGFTVELKRAEQKVDPGTMAAASYTSDVRVYDKAEGLNGKLVHISMNHPLEHNGYKFYQSELEVLEGVTDVHGRPVSRSGFTVGFDPGLELKYAGSIMLGIGIIMMFYAIVFLRAYVSKLRRSKPALETNE